MSNALLAPELAPADHPEVLHFLRGKDNPFDIFVAARKPDANFRRYHVPAVYREVYGALRAVVARYRPARLEQESDVPRSGVVVLLGNRGTGKTHMVHSLQQNADLDMPSIVVTPTILDLHRPFIEYLLHQLVRHFQNETAGGGPGRLFALADALARQVLIQAFYGIPEIDWLARHIDGRWSFWQYLFGYGVGGLAIRKRLLISELGQRENRTVLEVCERCDEDPQDLLTLAVEHINRLETGHTLGGQIRRGLYLELVRWAFGGSSDNIYDFLLDGYTRVETKSQPSREMLVDELFGPLIELCLLAKMPVVFAFDALETLLGDPPDKRLCQSFFQGLAEVLDSHRGIPFLLFAEAGHWQQTQMSEYARQRLQQGVTSVPGHGTLSILPFPAVSAEQLNRIVSNRMQPLLAEYYESEKFDTASIFPFTDDDLNNIARQPGYEPPLRQALQALRERYDQIVNGKLKQERPECGTSSEVTTATGPTAAETNFIEPMESCWQQEVRAAKRRLEGAGLSGLADELHSGIVKWFECLIAEGADAATGRPTAAANATFGSHPTYGQITQFDWDDGKATRKLGLGLLLGTGKGMPNDLETKLAMIGGKSPPCEALVLLWPRGADLEPPYHEQFPTATREVWDKRPKATRKVYLKAIAAEDLAPWLALSNWLNAVRNEANGVPADMIHHFVSDKTSALLNLVTPGD